jgi:tetratricopeptide (TPR) repeat protein
MGFRLRKSINIAPGVRLNFSKSGIGYSVGVKGYRVTHQVDGRTRRTASLPGTGLSYVTTSGSARSRPQSRPVALAPAPHVAKPGWFAPAGEKELYRAFEARDPNAAAAVATEHPELALAASTIAGVLAIDDDNDTTVREQLQRAFAIGADPAADPFIEKYVHALLSAVIAPGVDAELPLNRAAIGLALAELYQADGDLNAAVDVVEQLEPTSYAAVSLGELYLQLGRYQDVVALTDQLTNVDDATALLCVFRGTALREQTYYDAARAAFNEALKTKKRDPVIRHRAWLERARTYEAEGKRAQARKDLEAIMAEDSSYEGLLEALAELDDEPKN